MFSVHPVSDWRVLFARCCSPVQVLSYHSISCQLILENRQESSLSLLVSVIHNTHQFHGKDNEKCIVEESANLCASLYSHIPWWRRHKQPPKHWKFFLYWYVWLPEKTSVCSISTRPSDRMQKFVLCTLHSSCTINFPLFIIVTWTEMSVENLSCGVSIARFVLFLLPFIYIYLIVTVNWMIEVFFCGHFPEWNLLLRIVNCVIYTGYKC